MPHALQKKKEKYIYSIYIFSIFVLFSNTIQYLNILKIKIYLRFKLTSCFWKNWTKLIEFMIKVGYENLLALWIK